MPTQIRYYLIFFVILISVASCNNLMPAGFWTGYQKKFLLESISDQGPWGGRRALYWKANDKYKFTSSGVISFAEKNGWSFVDSNFLSVEEIAKINDNQKTFPFTYSDFNDSAMNTSAFPLWILSDVKVYRFKTGWTAIEPGNRLETEKNGYVLLSSDGKELSVYHLWGE